jgi:hypothetical protein
MKNSVDTIKGLLNLDQTNSANARVTAVADSTATVRICGSGKTYTASLADGSNSSGDLVRVTISGSTATIAGDSDLESTAALNSQTV